MFSTWHPVANALGTDRDADIDTGRLALPRCGQVEFEGLVEHLVAVTAWHQVIAVGHVAFVTTLLATAVATKIQELFHAGLLQLSVEFVSEMGTLESKLMASATEFRGSQLGCQSKWVSGLASPGDSCRQHLAVADVAGQAIDPVNEPLWLVGEETFESVWHLGGQLAGTGIGRGVTVQAPLSSAADWLSALDTKLLVRRGSGVSAGLPLSECFDVTRATLAVGPCCWRFHRDRRESMVEQCRSRRP